jgi:hypothetical protein
MRTIFSFGWFCALDLNEVALGWQGFPKPWGHQRILKEYKHLRNGDNFVRTLVLKMGLG